MEVIRAREPRVDIKSDEEQAQVVISGGLRYTHHVEPAQSSNSSQSIWAFQPPSTHTIMDRNLRVKYYIEVVSVGGEFQVGSTDALRQFPIASITENLAVSINGDNVSANVGDWAHAMLCYNSDRKDRSGAWSTTAAYPDQFQQYFGAGSNPDGDARNPMAGYGENAAEPSRGGFPAATVVDANTIRYEVVEPMLLSPFLTGQDDRAGLANVNQINVVLRHKSDLARVWSHAVNIDQVVTDVTVSFYRAPEILTTYITPDVLQSIPPKITYPYFKTQEYIRQVASVDAGATLPNIVSDSIKLNQVPRKMYVFCRRSRSTSTFQTPDSFAAITGVRVNWNNQSSLLGTASQQDLYHMSQRRGCNLDWPAFSEYRGSVVCAEFGTDIGLPDNQAPGSQGQHTFQVQIDIKNTSTAAVEYEFFLLFVLQGNFEIMPNAARATLGNLTQEMVLATAESSSVPWHQYQLMEGGSFLGGLRHLVNRTARAVETAAQVAQRVAPAVQSAAGVVRRATGGSVGGGMVGGSRQLRVRTMRRF